MQSRRQQKKLFKSVDFSTAAKEPHKNLQSIIETHTELQKDREMKVLSMMSTFSSQQNSTQERLKPKTQFFPPSNMENKSKVNVFKADQKVKANKALDVTLYQKKS